MPKPEPKPKPPTKGGGVATGGPIRTVPPDAGHQVTYKFTNIFTFETIAELPVNNPTFSLAVNAAGPWQATLATEDENIRKTNWINATAPWLTALWIDIDGALIYGGPVTGRKHQQSTGILTLSGADFTTYLSQRVQAGDYEAFIDPEHNEWAVEGKGASVPRIAYYLLKEAMEQENSLPIEIVDAASSVPDERYWITFSAPIAQRQTLLSMLTQLQQLGYLVGIDYACDVQYVAGAPTVAITLSYPRRGETGAFPPVIELSASTDMEYSEDGTQAGNRVIEQTGATAALATSGEWKPAWEDGYPLLEKVVSHAALSPTPASEAVLSAYVDADLAIYAYPLLAPVIPLPMFGSPSIFDLTPVGDDVILRIPKGSGDLPPNLPRFPEGLDYRFRVMRLDCSIPDEGLPTMSATLNIPPGTQPPTPPG